jgi:CheY-like chemotaxis protein/anti-sigma regulatory factor (Ser/Thr protein kinase)
VSDCADHLLGLVNDILDFARIESNQLELEQIEMSVGEEVEKAVSLHAAMAKKKRVSLLTQCVDIIPRDALRLGDPLRFRQILINLLSNAIKFTPEGGRVTVTASSSPTEPENICVRVEDTGIGIPPQGLEHIFKSFSQLDASVGRKFGGSGLGLAISKKLCHAMHGEIRVTSTVGVGSVFEFTVRLPRLLPPQAAPSSPPHQARLAPPCEVLEGTRVLVVEDNAINQKVATKMLTSLGCHVTVAGDGVAAVEMFEREAFDVILMDVQMPVMDGFQATARIRGIEFQQQATSAEEEEEEEEREMKMQMKMNKREGRVPIVALTASATRDYEAECLEKGMDRFLTKPFRKETLQATLVDILLLRAKTTTMTTTLGHNPLPSIASSPSPESPPPSPPS